jgi:serine/threonine-protein kinase
MDYVDGIDAGQLLEERYADGMPGPDVVEIVMAVAEALDYAHEHLLLHRDVKPANILIARPDAPDRRIMLADFGIAGLVGESTGLTATNMTVGTVAYAAPEQLMGNDLDGRADQYALAASAYQLLTGAPPFQHSNPAVVISQHLSASPPAIGERRPALANLDQVFSKALAKDPKDRYLRCVDFARALGHHLGGIGESDSTSASLQAVAAPPAKTSPLRSAVVIPAVLAILLVIAVALGVREYVRADDEEQAKSAAAKTSNQAPLQSPSPATTQQTAPTTTGTAGSVTASAVPLPVVAIGAVCSPLGSTGTTKTGATAYCSKLQDSNATIWSLTENTVASATVSAPPEPSESPAPAEQEGPIRVCVQQTGQTRRQCREEIIRGNGAP